MDKISFITLKKRRGTLILRNPVTVYEKYASGKNKGKTKKKRQIRYCPDLHSIYVDEQREMSDNPTPEAVYIAKGIKHVEEENVSLIEFLRIHPDNVANGGNLFKELDVAKEEEFEIARFEALDKARNFIMTSDENVVRSAAVWFLGVSYIKTSFNRLKAILRTKCENDEKFVTSLNKYAEEKNNDEKLMVTLAITEGVIEVKDGRKIVWSDSGHPVFVAAQAKDVIVDFATWLKNDAEGRETMKLIVDKLEK